MINMVDSKWSERKEEHFEKNFQCRNFGGQKTTLKQINKTKQKTTGRKGLNAKNE